MRVKTLVSMILAFLLLASSSTVAGGVVAVAASTRKTDAEAAPRSMLDSNASGPPVPIGVGVNLYPGGRPVQHVNSSDYFYVDHGFSVDNWSSLAEDVQSAFLDPQQDNFTLQTNASNFQNPSLTHYTDYNSETDAMCSMFFFQFSPGDLASGTYSFIGTWSSSGAANPPNYTASYIQNNITLVVAYAGENETREALVNGGFELGDLTGWIHSPPEGSVSAVTTDPRSGQYCACVAGLRSGIYQGFEGIPTSSIQSVTLWQRPENEMEPLGVDLYYSDDTCDAGQLWATVNSSSWSFFDVTSHLETGKVLIGIQLLGGGYLNGTSVNTYFDDVSILYTPVLPSKYDVTIGAYCSSEGTGVDVSITMDGTSTGLDTPHTFAGLDGIHTFALLGADPAGHPFSHWSTGQASATITVSEGGTYTAYYGTPLPCGNVSRVPQDYTSIQAAINAATPGSTIVIGPGVYNESIIVDKNLTIIGRLGSEPTFKGCGSGIAITLLPGASGSLIAGIVITSWDQGILVNNASECKIYDNIMSEMNNCGIALQGNGAYGNIICDDMFQNSTVAVDLSAASYNNTVYRNIISTNAQGILLGSSKNIVCANTIVANGVAMNLTGSGNNLVFHNNFVNNTVPVSVSASAGNSWDDGYPSGGNYWSNCTGPDLYSGADQDQPGADGIIDTGYTVAAGSVDRYPLAQPFNEHDIGITDFAVAKTAIGGGLSLPIEVKIMNYGLHDEDFLVTVYANTSAVALQSVSLAKCSYTVVVFSWNTTGFVCGNCTLRVCAGPVAGETNTGDNNVTEGSVSVSLLGDITGVNGGCDGKVDMRDIGYVARCFGADPSKRLWDPNADINGDGRIDMKDIGIAARHFGQHLP